MLFLSLFTTHYYFLLSFLPPSFPPSIPSLLALVVNIRFISSCLISFVHLSYSREFLYLCVLAVRVGT